MAEYTENYDLKKPEINDFVNIIDLNGNMDIINEALTQHDDDIQKKADKSDISNPNLLDNWYFTDPINQRGVSGTISDTGYFIDRWKLTDGSVEISSGGLLLNGTIIQRLETALSQPVSASYLTSAGIKSAEYDSAAKTFSITANNTLIIAAKLELGDRQTLAHQNDSGNWVLNDPPPNKALELAKCQRYQVVLNGYTRAYAVFGGPSSVSCIMPLPTTLRATPTLIGDWQVTEITTNDNMFSDGTLSITEHSPGNLRITVTKSGHGIDINNAVFAVPGGGKLIIDANL